MFQSIKKEFLLLTRDLGALVILFLMPLLLVVTITLLQDAAFKNISEQKVAIALVDNDKCDIAAHIKKQIRESHFFALTTEENGKPLTEERARKRVLEGKYLMAITLPEALSKDLHQRVSHNVESIISTFMEKSTTATTTPTAYTSKEVRIYFDPTVQTSFKENIKSNISKMMYEIENEFIYQAFQQQLEGNIELPATKSLVDFKEINPQSPEQVLLPNSTQHNVPAWTLFAIFFITIPLSASIVKEKTSGTGLRLFTSPLSYGALLTAKIIVFLCISLLQFALMVLIGIYVFPLIGLPALDCSGRWLSLILVALSSGLSAIGVGVLLGTLARTQEQSAPLGATLTVLLAAIGGVWIPTFAMPSLMQHLAHLSPMNWALQAFYDVLLRNASLSALLPKIALLIGFFALCMLISVYYENRKRNV